MNAALNMRTRAKICGITRIEDGLAAASAGADAIGLVFYARSPRAVSAEQARTIIAALPPFVTSVGLFVDAPAEEVEVILASVPLDLLQFHGDETPDYCRGFSRPYIKVVRMADEVDLKAVAAEYHDAHGLLLDSYQKGVPGGTGHAFDWARVPAGLGKPVILAGGLDPGNVAQAVRQVRPYAVDVSSGVEADKGIKDANRIIAFMRGVETADGD
jgi:phosphoribosylanthranilate isomerase